MSDTERLNFLLRFVRIDDVGDEHFFPNVIVDQEKMEEAIGFGPPNAAGRMMSNVHSLHDDIRDVIDRAIASHRGSRNDTDSEKARAILEGGR